MSPTWLFHFTQEFILSRRLALARFCNRRLRGLIPARDAGYTWQLLCFAWLSCSLLGTASGQAPFINPAPYTPIPADTSADIIANNPDVLFEATAAPLVTNVFSEASYAQPPGLTEGSNQPINNQPPPMIEGQSNGFQTAGSPTTNGYQEPPGNPFVAAPVIVGLPTSYIDTNNQMVVHPKIQWGAPVESNSPEMDVRWLQIHRPSVDAAGGVPAFFVQEPVLPQSASPLESMILGPESAAPPMPMFESIVADTPEVPRSRPRRWLDHSWWNCCPGDGLGQERLPFALVDIDPAQPFNNFRIRTQAVHRWKLPDRAEYLWQRTVDRRGPPLGESYMDYQQANLRMETGSKKLSAAFDVPLRATNPEVNRNHAGLGDMRLIVKTVMIEGEQWMVTQYFGTSLPTGSATMGLGRGKVALEPGLLIRNRMNDRTWNHNEIKFWFPLGGDPQHSGQVLKLATGFNRVFWETDRAALIPSLEFSSYSVLNGLARDASGTILPIDGDTMLYITPGLHYALDRKGDFGLMEISTGLSQAVTRQQFYGTSWTFDIRWSW